MALKIYLDTSVYSAFFDDRAPDRMLLTRQFWQQIDRFEAKTSELTRRELEQTFDPVRRKDMLGLLGRTPILPDQSGTELLAHRYIDAGVFSPAMINDALHVAFAVIGQQNVLVSWNFRHLVNRSRRARVNEVNSSAGFPTIEILAPPEL